MEILRRKDEGYIKNIYLLAATKLLDIGDITSREMGCNLLAHNLNVISNQNGSIEMETFIALSL